MALDSMQEIFDKIQAGRKPFWQVVRDTDVEERQVTAEASFEKMHATWRAMVESVDTYRADRRSVSGLVGGDAQRMWDYAAQQETLCGPYLQEVLAAALCVAESNACMHRIVAAPTAGACGVLPAVLIPLAEVRDVAEETILQALYIAAGFGQVTALRASVAGAEGGCQAEIGTASAMAAAALTHILGGTAQQCADAYAIALGNLLGLVCDPVAGLVEVPCVKRYVIGAVNAVSAANMAVAGITSRIPVDEVIDAMGEVGDALPASLREPGLGGLAATPTGRQAAERIARAEH